MAKRIAKVAAWVLVGLAVLAGAAVGMSTWRDQAMLSAQAHATPQVPPGAAAVSSLTDLALPPEINVATANLLRGRQDVLFVDVRSAAEFEMGHVPEARNIPASELVQRLSELPRDQAIILLCRSGRRSGAAAEVLRSEGFRNVYNVIGGLRAWQKAGLPAESLSGPSQ